MKFLSFFLPFLRSRFVNWRGCRHCGGCGRDPSDIDRGGGILCCTTHLWL